MPKPSTMQFNFKVPDTMLELIDRDIDESGEFRNRSEWALMAMRYFLDYRTKTIVERKQAFGLSAESNQITKEEEEGHSNKTILKNNERGGGNDPLL